MGLPKDTRCVPIAAVQRRSVLAAAVLGAAALLGACGGGPTKVDAGAAPDAVVTTRPATTAATTAATTPTTVAAATATPTQAAAAVADDATPSTVPAPTTAIVEVHFSTADGWHATATLRRDDGTTTEGVPVTAESPAIFRDLAPGTYAASVDAEGNSGYETPDATLAPPLQFVRGAAFTVNAGDHIVVDCDGPAGCVVT